MRPIRGVIPGNFQDDSPPQGETHPGLQSLAFASGEVVVRSISCGTTCISRLSSMGIIPGVRIKIIRNSGGPLLLEVKGSRVALGRGIAMKVYVEIPK